MNMSWNDDNPLTLAELKTLWPSHSAEEEHYKKQITEFLPLDLCLIVCEFITNSRKRYSEIWNQWKTCDKLVFVSRGSRWYAFENSSKSFHAKEVESFLSIFLELVGNPRYILDGTSDWPSVQLMDETGVFYLLYIPCSCSSIRIRVGKKVFGKYPSYILKRNFLTFTLQTVDGNSKLFQTLEEILLYLR